MTETLVKRLSALTNLRMVPREELEWLAAHGQLEVHEAGTVVAPKGKPIDRLWIILSGRIVVQVDRGSGPRRVTEWGTGDVSGMLPYSRMKAPPGNNYLETRSELLGIHVKHFPEMIHRCPVFTAYTVHSMLDRARSFSASDLQDEKMISLGKLAAGLAHELNNPASSAVRGAKLLLPNLAIADAASRALGKANLGDDLFNTIERVRLSCLAHPAGSALSPIQQADREDEIADWLRRHDVDEAHAQPLSDTAVTISELDTLAGVTSDETLAAALRWISAGCTAHTLAIEIEQAATRISDLVAAVKRFTYMDSQSGGEPVDVETGLRDTVRIMSSKAKSKKATIALDVEADLPRVRATGSELNQVWMNLIDNAIDAIPVSGRINISARLEGDRVIVRVADNGTGIPPDIVSRIFDPFFTTKPQGQGTGLGLDIARRLLFQSHGDIAVHSQPGLTEFRVSLGAETHEKNTHEQNTS
jgi:signal transduction histidine kinase